MNKGYLLGEFEIVASYKMYSTFLDRLMAVTKADVQRVAAKYLTESNRTVGWFIPSNEKATHKGAKESRQRARGAKKIKGAR